MNNLEHSHGAKILMTNDRPPVSSFETLLIYQKTNYK